MRKQKFFLLVVLYLCTLSLVAAKTNQTIVDAFENTKIFHVQQALPAQALEPISNATIYEASYGFDSHDGSLYPIGISNYFLKTGDALIAFDSEYELLSSPEFVATIQSDFYLKTLEDGYAFQTFFYAMDGNNFNEGFFIEGNTWYFVRDEFFGDLEVWMVETEDDGTILTMRHDYDADITMGEYVFEDRYQERYNDNEATIPVNEADMSQMLSVMKEKLVYELEISKLTSSALAKIGNATWYDCYITIIQEDEDMTYSSTEEVWVLEHDDSINFFADIGEVLASDAFIESLRPDFLLADEFSVELFGQALDAVSDFNRKEKTEFFRNGAWYFIRSESFSDGKGFIVHTDEMGHIQQIEFSYYISLVDEEEEVFDESNVVWTFDLIEPDSSSLTIPEGMDIPVEIAFNEAAADHYGAWIGVFQEDSLVSMYYSTSMKSPYTDTIPSEFLLLGKNTISYRLLYPGEDYENPIKKLDISITVVEP
jgi:formylmethanofuran dehydrogenase subunit D